MIYSLEKNSIEILGPCTWDSKKFGLASKDAGMMIAFPKTPKPGVLFGDYEVIEHADPLPKVVPFIEAQEDLLNQSRYIARRMIEEATRFYAPGEMEDWQEFKTAADTNDASFFAPFVVGCTQTAQEYLEEVKIKSDSLSGFKLAMRIARNKHKEAIAALKNSQECADYDRTKFWPTQI